MTDLHLSPEYRPLPVRLGLCDPIPMAPRSASDRRRIVIDGMREPWSDDERRLFLQQAHDAAQPGRFAP